jgi:hypothetical protein
MHFQDEIFHRRRDIVEWISGSRYNGPLRLHLRVAIGRRNLDRMWEGNGFEVVVRHVEYRSSSDSKQLRDDIGALGSRKSFVGREQGGAATSAEPRPQALGGLILSEGA